MRRRHLVLFTVLALSPWSVVACAGRAPADPTATQVASGFVRGPVSLDFDPAGNGDPVSLAWDDDRSTLYIADNRNDQIWTWTDKGGFARLVKVPSDPEVARAGGSDLGQIVKLADGTLVVPRFGGGKSGGVAYINPSGGAGGTVPKLARERKRLGLTRGAPLWGTSFGEGRSTDDAGVVAKITFDGETDYAGGFQKPVGVLVHEGRLIVSDQTRGVLYSLPLEGAKAPYDVFARVETPDALSEGPNGSVLTGQFRAGSEGGALHVRQIFPDGGVRNVAPDIVMTKPKGIAYDKTNKRLFVADSNGSTVRTLKILPLE